MKWNRRAVQVFAPILILTGVLGLVHPSPDGPMSQAVSYDVFHIIAGSIGLALAMWAPALGPRLFNLAFGAIDLYQLAASRAGLFPARWFQWRWGDDVVHLVIGVALVAIGAAAWRPEPPTRESGADGG